MLLAARSDGGDPQEEDASQKHENPQPPGAAPGRKDRKGGRALGQKRLKVR